MAFNILINLLNFEAQRNSLLISFVFCSLPKAGLRVEIFSGTAMQASRRSSIVSSFCLIIREATDGEHIK